MDALRQIADSLAKDGYPSRVITKARNWLLQSQQSVGLKPSEEPARSYICVYLALEFHLKRQGSEVPEPRPPVPPALFNKLLAVFKSNLGIEDAAIDFSAPSTPSKRNSQPSTPSKRRSVARASPQKTPTRTPKKSQNVDTSAIQDLGYKLDLAKSTIEAILTGYLKYTNLVKDQWGLVLGLAYTIVQRAEPEQNNLKERLVASVPIDMARERLEEWIIWATYIVTGQTWVSKVSVEPEPMKKLYTGPGTWDLW